MHFLLATAPIVFSLASAYSGWQAARIEVPEVALTYSGTADLLAPLRTATTNSMKWAQMAAFFAALAALAGALNFPDA
ncbi:hypothetical protein [Parvibaculum sp.]|uniref:hypothetical protein n=1 Tax=Parvibaculum sp. TaxID=2024848 RepID=UPI003299C093